MSSATINFPPPRANAPFVRKDGTIDLQALQNFLALYNSAALETVSTVAGNANFGVPLASLNQNAERVYVKISADGNVPTLVASGSDKINGAVSLAMATAQYSQLRLKSDGVSNWYVVAPAGASQARIVQTARLVYTFTATDVTNGFAAVNPVWSAAFADTNYTVATGFVYVSGPNASGMFSQPFVLNKTVNGCTVTLWVGAGAAGSKWEFDLVAVHD